MTTVWMTAREYTDGFDVIGIFSSIEDAVNAATEYDDYVGPIMLDFCYPDPSCEWDGLFYPNHH